MAYSTTMHSKKYILQRCTRQKFILAIIMHIIAAGVWGVCAERDFNVKGSKVPFFEPEEETLTQQRRAPYTTTPVDSATIPGIRDNGAISYSRELESCRYHALGKQELVLSIVMKSKDLVGGARKSTKEKLAGKSGYTQIVQNLSKFFAVPKEFIEIDSVTKQELKEMQKKFVLKGNNKCHINNRQLGRVNIVIGCGATYFTMGKPIVHQIGAQMKDGTIDAVTGEKFGWWVVWRRDNIAKRSSRVRRQATEGSGEEQDYEDDYDYEDESEADNAAITDVPTTTTHAHRHHHGQDKSDNMENGDVMKSGEQEISIDESDTDINDVNPLEKDYIYNKFAVTATAVTEKVGIIPKNVGIEKVMTYTSTSPGIDQEIVEGVSQLESVITKTIENTKLVKDVLGIQETVDRQLDEEQEREELSAVIDGEDNRTTTEHQVTEDTFSVDSSFLIPLEQRFKVSTTSNFEGSNVDAVRVDNNHKLISVAPSTVSDINLGENVIYVTNSNLIPNKFNSSSSSIPVYPAPPLESTTSAGMDTFFSSTLTGLDDTAVTATPNVINTSFGILTVNHQSTKLLNHSLISSSNSSTTIADVALVPIGTQQASNISDQEYVSSSSPMWDLSLSSSLASSSFPPTTLFSNISSPSPSLISHSTFLTTTPLMRITGDGEKDDIESSTKTTTQIAEVADNVVQSNNSFNVASTEINLVSNEMEPVESFAEAEEEDGDDIDKVVVNSPPIINKRLEQFQLIGGKLFTHTPPVDTFYDNEEHTNLRWELTDEKSDALKPTSWLQFDVASHSFYGIPLDNAVHKYEYRLTAFDSANASVTDTVRFGVQQHHSIRAFNHEINIAVKINDHSIPGVDWQMKLARAIANTLGDVSTHSIVVTGIKQTVQDPSAATFVYFNESLPINECPEMGLNDIVRRLNASRISELVYPTLGIKSITGQLTGHCHKQTKPQIPTTNTIKNHGPEPRNQVDLVNASVGHLLVYKVPVDTFYDPNDDPLVLKLRTKDLRELNPNNWLQFDSKNSEFYGVPRSADVGSEEYLLVAEDSAGQSATDALVVEVKAALKRDYSVLFKAFLAVRFEQFNADLQRKFVERIARLHSDSNTANVYIRSVTPQHDSDGTVVNFYNVTLYRQHNINRCPEDEIEAVRNVYLVGNLLRDRVKKELGSELNLTNMQVTTQCQSQVDVPSREFTPAKTEEPTLKSTFAHENMYTIILPAIIIVVMILIGSIIACCLHRRHRKSGKMEIGDDEERKAFRTKGIPVIFQDELDEKPEIGKKSPTILKDEKPPLLPQSSNTATLTGGGTGGDNDVDEYVPPPAVVVGGREVRGKSPATPSYRKPPPYVSP